jgi:hypothetical protein
MQACQKRALSRFLTFILSRDDASYGLKAIARSHCNRVWTDKVHSEVKKAVKAVLEPIEKNSEQVQHCPTSSLVI